MSLRKITSIAALLVAHLGSSSYAQGTSCVDRAQSKAEVDKCGRLLIDPLHKSVYAELQRLSDKFKGNKEMLEMLSITDHDWKAYWNTQCMFEGFAAAGGQTDDEVPLASSKAFVMCVHRILLERQTALSKF